MLAAGRDAMGFKEAHDFWKKKDQEAKRPPLPATSTSSSTAAATHQNTAFLDPQSSQTETEAETDTYQNTYQTDQKTSFLDPMSSATNAKPVVDLNKYSFDDDAEGAYDFQPNQPNNSYNSYENETENKQPKTFNANQQTTQNTAKRKPIRKRNLPDKVAQTRVINKPVQGPSTEVKNPNLDRFDPKTIGESAKGNQKKDVNNPMLRDRLPLTETEQASEGYAQVPLQNQYLHGDAGSMFTAIYRFNNEDEIDERMSNNFAPQGFQQEADRDDHVFKIVNGKLVHAKDQSQGLDTTTNGTIPGFLAKSAELQAQQERGRPLEDEERKEVHRELARAGGRYIWVMNAAGEFFCGPGIVKIQHHSSFLAGGAVAGAGDLVAKEGEIKLISNSSGHYMPGPVYMWQALVQLGKKGVDLKNIDVELEGISKPGEAACKASTLVETIDPVAEKKWWDDTWAQLELKKKFSKGKAEESKKDDEAELVTKSSTNEIQTK